MTQSHANLRDLCCLMQNYRVRKSADRYLPGYGFLELFDGRLQKWREEMCKTVGALRGLGGEDVLARFVAK